MSHHDELTQNAQGAEASAQRPLSATSAFVAKVEPFLHDAHVFGHSCASGEGLVRIEPSLELHLGQRVGC